MKAFDKVPETSPDMYFPYGDVDISPEAEEWLETLDEDDWEEFMSYFDDVDGADASTHYLARLNRNLAQDVCDRWDQEHGGEYASLGYKISRNFIEETELLPAPVGEIRLALISMKHEVTAAQFASSAWQGIAQSHPRVFGYLETIYDYAEKESDLDIANNAEQFIAGMCLPYMMSVAACMATDAKVSEFTGMVNLDEHKFDDLQAIPFETLFTSDPKPENRRPAERNGLIAE